MYFIISLFCFVLFCLVLASAEYHFDPVVYCMIPFYVMYIAFVPLHAKFALAMYRIGLRYRSLNNIIDVYAAASEFLMPFINSSLDITSFSFFLVFSANKNGYFRSDFKQAENVIYRFKRIYDALGKVLDCLSRYFVETFFFILTKFWPNSICYSACVYVKQFVNLPNNFHKNASSIFIHSANLVSQSSFCWFHACFIWFPLCIIFWRQFWTTR